MNTRRQLAFSVGIFSCTLVLGLGVMSMLVQPAYVSISRSVMVAASVPYFICILACKEEKRQRLLGLAAALMLALFSSVTKGGAGVNFLSILFLLTFAGLVSALTMLGLSESRASQNSESVK